MPKVNKTMCKTLRPYKALLKDIKDNMNKWRDLFPPFLDIPGLGMFNNIRIWILPYKFKAIPTQIPTTILNLTKQYKINL